MYRNFHGQMQIYDCIIEIEVDGNKQIQTMQAPRIMLEQQFLGLMQQAANDSAKVKIKMSRKFPVYDEIYDKWIEQTSSITFTNKQYDKVHPKDDNTEKG